MRNRVKNIFCFYLFVLFGYARVEENRPGGTMQFRNRIIALLLALISLLLLTACGDILQAITLTPMPTAMLTPTATPTPTPTPTLEPTPYHDIYPITFGLSTGSSYLNEYFDIAFEVDDLWFVYSTEQYDKQNELSGLTKEKLRQQAYIANLSSGNIIMDYDAVLRTGLKEIVIKINDVALIKDKYPNAASYQKAVAQDVSEAFQEIGTEIYNNEIKTETIAGQQASCWYLSYADDAYMVYVVDISIWRGDYNIGIILTSNGADNLQEMIAMLHAVD